MDAPEGEARLSAEPRPRGRMDEADARARVRCLCAYHLAACGRVRVPPVVALQRLGWVCVTAACAVLLLPSIRCSDLRKASEPASFLALFLALAGSFGCQMFLFSCASEREASVYASWPFTE